MSTCFLNVLGHAEVVRHAVAAANKWAPLWLAAMTRARAILLKCDPPLKIANLHVEVVDTRGVDDVRARRDPRCHQRAEALNERSVSDAGCFTSPAVFTPCPEDRASEFTGQVGAGQGSLA